MFKKIADTINMSFDIPSSEKEMAENAIEYLESVMGHVRFAEDHLDIMYQIFTKHDNIPSQSVFRNRGVIDKFKEKVKENYNIILNYSMKAIRELEHFEIDGQISELISSYDENIDNIEKAVNNFLKNLGKYKMPNYRSNILASINNIKKKDKQLVNLIKDRIIEHINTNIIAETWTASTSKKLNEVVEEKVPHLVQLYKERTNRIPVEPKQNQSLNPSDAQSTWYPTTTRTREIGE